MPKDIVVVGIPSAAGAFSDRPSRSTGAIRQAGLAEALRQRGHRVSERADLPAFPFRDDPEHPTCRNTKGVAEAVRATADEVAAALPEGFAIVLGGDCSLLPGVVAGARRHVGGPVGLAFLDAHGDLNTPQTTPSGRLSGMALAVTLGHGAAEVVGAVEPQPLLDAQHTVMLGFRDLDGGEKPLVQNVGVALSSEDLARIGPAAGADQALRIIGERPFVVHFDVDIVDANDMPTQAPPAGGQGLRHASATSLLCGLLRSKQALGISVTGFDPDRDATGVHARALVQTLAEALSPA